MLGCSVVQYCVVMLGVWRHMPANITEYTNIPKMIAIEITISLID
jgi:hypothetical protein